MKFVFVVPVVALLLSLVHGAIIRDSLAEKRCPMVSCSLVACGKGSFRSPGSFFDWHGKTCPSCPTCFKVVNGKRDLDDKTDMVVMNVCPMVMCAYSPNSDCLSSEYVQTYFKFEGKQCPGCRACPVKPSSSLF